MSRPVTAPPGGATLATLEEGCTATIIGIRPPDGPALAEHIQRLMELGFLPGASVRVVATGFPAGDPIAVRIGRATFALRRFEADLIGISPGAVRAGGMAR
ncbi:MAG: FeoA family protein [Burkholderiales bacterium]